LKDLYQKAKCWYGHIKGPEHGEIWLSLIVPTYNSQVRHLNDLYNSVQSQAINGIEIIFSDDASSSSETRDWLNSIQQTANITVIFNQQNEGISAASNHAIKMARGTWISFLDHDDLIAPYGLQALFETISELPESDDVQFIYTDEAIVDDKLRVLSLFLKPAFDPILLSGVNYINHFSVYRRDQLLKIGLLNPQRDGSQDYDMVLRYTSGLSDNQIRHLPFPAYWWRRSSGTYSRSFLDKALIAARTSISHAYQQDAYELSVQPSINPELHKPSFMPKDGVWPKIGIIIPNKNAPDLISKIIPDLFEKTDYPNFEVLVIDNGSDNTQTLTLYETFQAKWKSLHVSIRKEAFNFSRSVNRGFEGLDVDHYLLLNNDVRVIDDHWLKEMVSCLAYEKVGVVGAKLLFGNNSFQHAGVIVGQRGLAGHWYYRRSGDIAGPMGRLHVRNGMNCVTGAVMLISGDCQRQIGLFDEENFAVAFNDVDYCLRAHKAGYRIVWTPHACLYHLESASRGSDKSKASKERFAREQANLRRIHHTETYIDTACHPLHSWRTSIPQLGPTLHKPKPRKWLETQ
jgi:GT2 family glycosyltransferase